MSISDLFVSNIIEESSGTIFRLDGHDISLFVVGHGSRHFGWSERDDVDFGRILIGEGTTEVIDECFGG